ncbi:MAG TPA: PilZ domain-containing protein [Candidatus Binatia bacterium]|nr:PilZ domain-containing protein [Candidatus Binatia bacterium]
MKLKNSEAAAGERKKGSESVAAEGTAPMTEAQTSAAQFEDLQSAPRFPLHLAASIKAQGSAYAAETENISANGVLFAMDNDVPVGSMVDFTIMLPAEVMGTRRNMQIDCRGRVVRSFEDRGRRGVGVVIDEYHFERA